MAFLTLSGVRTGNVVLMLVFLTMIVALAIGHLPGHVIYESKGGHGRSIENSRSGIVIVESNSQ